MRYLLVKEKSGKFVLYCPELFGSETWGMSTQLSLEKKRKYWYIHHWIAGNNWVDDENYDERINVVLETNSLQQIINHINANGGKRTDIESILVKAQQLYYEQIELENWANSRKQER